MDLRSQPAVSLGSSLEDGLDPVMNHLADASLAGEDLQDRQVDALITGSAATHAAVADKGKAEPKKRGCTGGNPQAKKLGKKARARLML